MNSAPKPTESTTNIDNTLPKPTNIHKSTTITEICKLPLKKRKLSLLTKSKDSENELLASLEQEIRVANMPLNDISYPATPMVSIAELEALSSSKLRFKTPAERKEMPRQEEPSSLIIQQYSTPITINSSYHVDNLPAAYSTSFDQVDSEMKRYNKQAKKTPKRRRSVLN